MPSERRTVMKVLGGGAEQIVRMSDLRKNDRFRLIADHPADCLYDKQDKVYTATSDAYQTKGIWGVDVEGNDA